MSPEGQLLAIVHPACSFPVWEGKQFSSEKLLRTQERTRLLSNASAAAQQNWSVVKPISRRCPCRVTAHFKALIPTGLVVWVFFFLICTTLFFFFKDPCISNLGWVTIPFLPSGPFFFSPKWCFCRAYTGMCCISWGYVAVKWDFTVSSPSSVCLTRCGGPCDLLQHDPPRLSVGQVTAVGSSLALGRYSHAASEPPLVYAFVQC